jgi:hypothetical protein
LACARNLERTALQLKLGTYSNVLYITEYRVGVYDVGVLVRVVDIRGMDMFDNITILQQKKTFIYMPGSEKLAKFSN